MIYNSPNVYFDSFGDVYTYYDHTLQCLLGCGESEDRFFISTGEKVTIEAVGNQRGCTRKEFDPPLSVSVFRTYEVMEEDFPFSFPFALPVCYRLEGETVPPTLGAVSSAGKDQQIHVGKGCSL